MRGLRRDATEQYLLDSEGIRCAEGRADVQHAADIVKHQGDRQLLDFPVFLSRGSVQLVHGQFAHIQK